MVNMTVINSLALFLRFDGGTQATAAIGLRKTRAAAQGGLWASARAR
jgi:hypothetical protein